MVDLHTHSNISDGELSPELLVEKAVKQGLKAIALTDHDTIKGLQSAKAAAQTFPPFKFIPGIEVNINWANAKYSDTQISRNVPGLGPGGEFHLLGLGIKSPSSAFLAAVEKLTRCRERRNLEIIDRMHELSLITIDNKSDMDDILKELLVIAGGESRGHLIGRPHFAAFLLKHKIVKNINQAFSRYLGVGMPLYVPKEGLAFDEAVALIRESGGISVLAHPISLYVAWGRLPDLVKALKDMGLMGLEAWHPTAKPGSCRRLESLAHSLGLYVTEGSDFHGSLRPDRLMGCSSKGRTIDDSVLEAIPELLT
ncbi:MAG: PHP domain-containing protein [Treponema sp.]|nr:PHP domain-containing protein [Treponema sp.]